MRLVLDRLLKIRMVVVIVHVPLVIDRRVVSGGGQDLLGGAAGLNYPVRYRVVLCGVRSGAAGEIVEPGDSLRFLYTSREAGYLAVLSQVSGGRAYPLGRPILA